MPDPKDKHRPGPGAEAARTSVQLEQLRGRILGVLNDRKPWRLKHLIKAAGAGAQRSRFHAEVYRLLENGQISRPAHGVFVLAGVPAPAAGEIPPLRDPDTVGPSHARILKALGKPRSAAALLKFLPVSRQRIDQILKRLWKHRKVKRLEGPGGPTRWLWLRSEVEPPANMERRPPPITKTPAALLSAMQLGAVHSVADLARLLAAPRGAVSAIAVKASDRGLAVTFRLGQQQYVGITPRGMMNRERSEGAAAAPVADPAESLGPLGVAFIEVLASLGEATSSELTAALAPEGSDEEPAMSGQLVQGLLRSGLAEPVEQVGRQPTHYRLSAAGRFVMALLSRTRRPPRRDELEHRIARYRAAQAERVPE
jgi:hypothetical protein